MTSNRVKNKNLITKRSLATQNLNEAFLNSTNQLLPSTPTAIQANPISSISSLNSEDNSASIELSFDFSQLNSHEIFEKMIKLSKNGQFPH